MSAKAMVVAMDVAANVFTVPLPPDAQALEIEGVAVVIVRADSSIDLFMLTFDPLSPVALVKMLTVTSCAVVPPKTADDPDPKRLTPLNLVSAI